MLAFQIVVALLLLVIYWQVRPGWQRSGPFLPDAFVIGLLLYAAGAAWLSVFEPAPNLDRVASMAWTALASGTAGAATYCLLAARMYEGRFADDLRQLSAGPLERSLIFVGLASSALASLLFVYLVVRTDVIAALLGVGSFATDANLLRARMAIASGTEAYFAPGYFKQFRDILLPVLLAALLLTDRRQLRSLFFWGCVACGLVAMVVSGQRLVVVIFLLTLGLASHYSRRASQSSVQTQRFSMMPLILVLAGYGLLTALLGRLSPDATGSEVALNVVSNLLDRAFLAAPRENAISYALWSAVGPTAGWSWWQDLLGVLPGVNQNLSNLLHMATGGSAAGNSPLGLPADVWLAWGWPGLLLVPPLFGMLAGVLDRSCSLRKSPVLTGLRLYLFLVLPICYSPFLFLLYGGAVALVLIAAVTALRPLPASSVRLPG